MTVSLPARWAAVGLAGATAAVGLPLLAAATSSPASAQQSPQGCSSATPTSSASATPTATTSATPTSTTTPGSLPGPISTLIATLDPRPTSTGSATPTSSTSATPTATSSPCPTGSATATATTSATPTATTSSSPTPAGGAAVQCQNPIGLTLDRAFLTPGMLARVTISAPAGADVELQAYSRPSTTYRQVRRGTVPPSGQLAFDVRPGTNTRLFANCVSQTRSVSAQRVLNVRTALSLTVVRNGRRDYTFQGRLLPRRADQLITLYRVRNDGTRIITRQIRSDATGTYRIRRVFTGSGRFGFLTRTGQTLTNASGESNTRDQNSGRGTARPTEIF